MIMRQALVRSLAVLLPAGGHARIGTTSADCVIAYALPD